LLKVLAVPLEAIDLLENTLADGRDYFFIAGVSFWPPQAKLAEWVCSTSHPADGFCLGQAESHRRKNVSIHQGKTIHLKGSAYLGSLSSSVIQIYFYTLLESVKIFANAEAAKRYAFLKAFQIRACG
jgi:hypothetical protein